MEKNTVNELLKELLITVKDVKGFTLEHAPDVVKQMVDREKFCLKQDIYQGLSLALIGLIVAKLSFSIFYVKNPDNVNWQVLVPVALLLFILSISTVWKSYISLKKLEIAPKLFILNKLKSLIATRK